MNKRLSLSELQKADRPLCILKFRHRQASGANQLFLKADLLRQRHRSLQDSALSRPLL